MSNIINLDIFNRKGNKEIGRVIYKIDNNGYAKLRFVPKDEENLGYLNLCVVGKKVSDLEAFVEKTVNLFRAMVTTTLTTSDDPLFYKSIGTTAEFAYIVEDNLNGTAVAGYGSELDVKHPSVWFTSGAHIEGYSLDVFTDELYEIFKLSV